MEYTKNKEKNFVNIELTITKEEYAEFDKKAYEKDKGQYTVNGFRKGQVPKGIIEKNYGANVFFETAVNLVLDKYYDEIIEKEKDFINFDDVIDKPDFDIKSFDDNGLTITIKFQLFPEVTLGAYEGLEFEKAKVTVTEDDVMEELKKYQEQSARMVDVVDRAVVDGDIVNIDFEGKVNGVAFPGGTAKKYDLTIGSHSFIEGFEPQIIGMNIGETKDINVTFPENYTPELAGKDAVFTVVLHSIKEKQLPEINDELASDCSTFSTLEELKADIKENILKTRERQAEYDVEDKIVAEITKNTVVDIPQVFIENQLEDDMKRIEANLKYQGIDMATYCKISGKTVDEIKEERRPAATENVKSQIVLQEIIKREKITASEEEVDAKIQERADGMKITKEKYLETAPKNIMNNIQETIIVEKLFKLLKEKNTIKEI